MTCPHCTDLAERVRELREYIDRRLGICREDRKTAGQWRLLLDRIDEEVLVLTAVREGET